MSNSFNIIPCTSKELQPLVRYYFTISTGGATVENRTLIPNVSNYIVFHLKGEVTYHVDHKKLFFKEAVSINSLHDSSFSAEIAADSLMFAVVLKPYAISRLFKKAYDKNGVFIADSRTLLGGNDLHRLCKKLIDTDTIDSRIEIVEKYLENMMENCIYEDQVSAFVDYLENNRPNSTVRQAAKHLLVSQRTLEQKFLKATGLTPGRYIKLIRFINLLKEYSTNQYTINDLVIKYGYTDYSHLSRSFKKHTGRSLKELHLPPDSLYNAYLKASGVLS